MVASGVQTQEHTDLDPRQQFDNPRMISGLMVIELTADAKVYRQNSCCNKLFFPCSISTMRNRRHRSCIVMTSRRFVDVPSYVWGTCTDSVGTSEAL